MGPSQLNFNRTRRVKAAFNYHLRWPKSLVYYGTDGKVIKQCWSLRSQKSCCVQLINVTLHYSRLKETMASMNCLVIPVNAFRDEAALLEHCIITAKYSTVHIWDQFTIAEDCLSLDKWFLVWLALTLSLWEGKVRIRNSLLLSNCVMCTTVTIRLIWFGDLSWSGHH